MKKKTLLSFFIIILSIFAFGVLSASAEQLDSSMVEYKTEYPNFYRVRTYDDIAYMTDKEYNIILGPFKYIVSDDTDSWFRCIREDESEVLYDADLNELASVLQGGYICSPENGIYGVSQTKRITTEIRDFQLFDLKTNELLSTPGYFVYYYMEEQDEKMAIKKDGKFAIINKYGEYLTDFIIDKIKQRFRVRDEFLQPYMIVEIDGEEKYMDWDLNFIDIDNYNGGYFITDRFNMKAKAQETSFWRLFSGEKEAVYNSETDKIIVPFDDGCTFKYASTDGVTFEGFKDGLSGLFDNEGNLLIDFKYSGISHTSVPEIVRLYKDGGENGYYNLSRNEYIPKFAGEVADGGLVIKTEYVRKQIQGAPVVGDKYTENVPISSRVLNFAGHDVMGKEYKPLTCVNSVFMEDTDGDREGDTPIEVKRDFAIIRLNGEYLDFDGVIVDGRTLVPVREIAEGFDGEVSWNGRTNTATLHIDSQEIAITIENDIMLVNGESIFLDVPAKLLNNKTMLPVRKLAEILGANVEWDEVLKCVHIFDMNE